MGEVAACLYQPVDSFVGGAAEVVEKSGEDVCAVGQLAAFIECVGVVVSAMGVCASLVLGLSKNECAVVVSLQFEVVSVGNGIVEHPLAKLVLPGQRQQGIR